MSGENLADALRFEITRIAKGEADDHTISIIRDSAEAIEALWQAKSDLIAENASLRKTLASISNQDLLEMALKMDDVMLDARTALRRKITIALIGDAT